LYSYARPLVYCVKGMPNGELKWFDRLSIETYSFYLLFPARFVGVS
jgi:hypothetical protein